jgi:hypothetical protein
MAGHEESTEEMNSEDLARLEEDMARQEQGELSEAQPLEERPTRTLHPPPISNNLPHAFTITLPEWFHADFTGDVPDLKVPDALRGLEAAFDQDRDFTIYKQTRTFPSTVRGVTPMTVEYRIPSDLKITYLWQLAPIITACFAISALDGTVFHWLHTPNQTVAGFNVKIHFNTADGSGNWSSLPDSKFLYESLKEIAEDIIEEGQQDLYDVTYKRSWIHFVTILDMYEHYLTETQTDYYDTWWNSILVRANPRLGTRLVQHAPPEPGEVLPNYLSRFDRIGFYGVVVPVERIQALILSKKRKRADEQFEYRKRVRFMKEVEEEQEEFEEQERARIREEEANARVERLTAAAARGERLTSAMILGLPPATAQTQTTIHFDPSTGDFTF